MKINMIKDKIFGDIQLRSDLIGENIFGRYLSFTMDFNLSPENDAM